MGVGIGMAPCSLFVMPRPVGTAEEKTRSTPSSVSAERRPDEVHDRVESGRVVEPDRVGLAPRDARLGLGESRNIRWASRWASGGSSAASRSARTLA